MKTEDTGTGWFVKDFPELNLVINDVTKKHSDIIKYQGHFGLNIATLC